jgi:hypothetical protein
MEVLVYVEGRSDMEAMNQLLKPLLERKTAEGVAIRFLEPATGDRKKQLLLAIPERAANILRNRPQTHIVVMPDVYPKNKGFAHESFAEMKAGVLANFRRKLKAAELDDQRLLGRFHIFAFKHDLEALLLAFNAGIEARLKQQQIPVTWTIPVEDQNLDQPPKRIVEALFKTYGESYRDTVDAPAILSLADYQAIAEACPQCFKPFVDYLESLKGD